ncbi:hypothetical protein BDV96DRAFT_237353 [Lophiotrema nucula]|uniref:Uncharacterized protein n=1 Tax=Lophiotrema nucula TaxID=690887 RepID=A0A6A5YQW2_9PLEO|nr:hypothetical protein BDV96DRAFT_237353 [Lophiotrema nucula]
MSCSQPPLTRLDLYNPHPIPARPAVDAKKQCRKHPSRGMNRNRILIGVPSSPARSREIRRDLQWRCDVPGGTLCRHTLELENGEKVYVLQVVIWAVWALWSVYVQCYCCGRAGDEGWRRETQTTYSTRDQLWCWLYGLLYMRPNSYMLFLDS